MSSGICGSLWFTLELRGEQLRVYFDVNTILCVISSREENDDNINRTEIIIYLNSKFKASGRVPSCFVFQSSRSS